MHGMRVLIGVLLSVFLCCTGASGAQSTKDVTASEALKSQARAELLGERAAARPADPEYVIGHGDVLGVEVYGEGSMAIAGGGAETRDDGRPDAPRATDKGAKVRIDGRVSLRHIGDVEAVGLTLPQFADYLKTLYATVYADPIVTVVLQQSNSQRYTVMGKVNSPGIYFLDYPINLVQVVARAGGFSEWANNELTVVRKGGAGSEQFADNTLKFDYDDFLAGKELERNVLIHPGDIIIAH